VSRILGRSGIKVSDVGFGCWAIGGPMTGGGQPIGWGVTDDAVSVAAIWRALDLGITFFDTADVYGGGHSELVLGEALAGHRDEVVIATKFGYTFDAEAKVAVGADASPGYVRLACEASLRRLGTDRIDLYQLHQAELPLAEADLVIEALEQLVADGLIRSYGWSTDDPVRAAAFAAGANCAAIQHGANVLVDTPEMFAVCDSCDLASVIRSPLAMGLLTGKYTAQSQLAADDCRSGGMGAPAFTGGRPTPEWLARLDAIREVLTSGGRNLAQGALGWLLARGQRTVPIPGIRTVEQAAENAGALRTGPLSAAEMAQIATLLAAGQEPGD
jgi:aryl-alcohol dehydrogenase-like predicted oxidoreductase